MATISKRLSDIVDALPLKKGMRVLEIGCGPGVAAREIVQRFHNIYVLGIDRSATAILKANKSGREEVKQGMLEFRKAAIEIFELEDNDQKFDIAFAVRVGVLDGRHPQQEAQAILQITRALKKNGKLFIDGGNPLKEVTLKNK